MCCFCRVLNRKLNVTLLYQQGNHHAIGTSERVGKAILMA